MELIFISVNYRNPMPEIDRLMQVRLYVNSCISTAQSYTHWFTHCLVPIYVFPEMKLLFPKQNYNLLSPSSCTHITVRDLYISRIGLLLILLQGNMWTDPGDI
jgi:hypothetical protein